MDIQRIRNLTTGRLHTKMQDIYEDIEYITCEEGIMTHHLGMACEAMKPWLLEKLPISFFDGKYSPELVGDIPISPMTKEEQAIFWENFSKQPNPLFK